jgi:pimeloyl-ACP methyl ester carboxylesterase
MRPRATVKKLALVSGAVAVPIAAALLLRRERTSLPEALAGGLRRRHLKSGAVAYYADTRGHGRPLVLLHSINAAASSYEMKPLYDFYRGKRPVFALDLLGFGHSDRVDRTYSPELYGELIAQFLDEVVGEPADVVALSLTCEFTARAARYSATNVASLTFLSPTGLSARSRKNAVESARARQKSGSVHAALAFPLWSRALFAALTSTPSIRYYLKQSFVGEVDQGLVRYALQTSRQPGAEHAPLWFLSGALFTPNARRELYSAVDCPVHVLYDEDAHVSFDCVPELLAERANVRASRITPTRGLPHFERLKAVVDAMEAFFTEAEAASGERLPRGANGPSGQSENAQANGAAASIASEERS